MPWHEPYFVQVSCPLARSPDCWAVRRFYGCCDGVNSTRSCKDAMKSTNSPQRIVCLTGETTETLYLLGEDERIVGISGYTCRPKEARLKPKVSAFTTAKIDKILELRPDLVIGFSNLQAAIAQELIQAGVTVIVFNQRSIEEIFETILMLPRILAAETAGLRLAGQLRGELARIAESAARFPRRPRVFFE